MLGWAKVNGLFRVCYSYALAGMIARGTLNVFHVILNKFTALYLVTDLTFYLL